MPTLEAKGLGSRIVGHVRRTLVAGSLAALPIIVTYLVVRWLFGFLDGLFAPLVDRAIGFHIPGVGLLISLAVFYLFGMISVNVIGRQFEEGLQMLLSRVPGLRTIYVSAKQVVATFAATKGTQRQRVVLVEFPAKGHYMVGFVTHEMPGRELHPEGSIAVFVPTSPNPTSGALLFLPGTAVIPTSMSTEEAFRVVLSGGVIVPPGFGRGSPLGDLTPGGSGPGRR
jgi:uncharacterized membrane protein